MTMTTAQPYLLNEVAHYHIRSTKKHAELVDPILPFRVRFHDYDIQSRAVEWCEEWLGCPMFKPMFADLDVYKAKNEARWDYWGLRLWFRDEKDLILFKLAGFPVEVCTRPVI